MTPCTVYLIEGLVRGGWSALTIVGGEVSVSKHSATVFLDRPTAKMVCETIKSRRLELKLKPDDVRLARRVARNEDT